MLIPKALDKIRGISIKKLKKSFPTILIQNTHFRLKKQKYSEHMVGRLEMYDESLEEWVAEADIQPGRSKLLYDRKPINDDVYIIESSDTYTVLLKVAEPLIIDKEDKVIILKDVIGDDIIGKVTTGDEPLEFEVEMSLDEPLTKYRLSHI